MKRSYTKRGTSKKGITIFTDEKPAGYKKPSSGILILPVRKAAPSRPKIQRTDSEWLLLVDKFNQSGMTSQKFCLLHRISAGSFSRKRRMLQEKYKNRAAGEIPEESNHTTTV